MARLKIYTDENVDVRVAEGLKRRGVHAFSALEKKMTGASDREHLRFAAESRLSSLPTTITCLKSRLR